MTNLIHLTEETVVNRPAAEVWAVVADYGHDPEWRDGVVTMDPSPAGVVEVGATTREEIRFMGRVWHNDGVVVDVEPGRRFTWRTTQGADADGSRTVAARPDGTCTLRLDLAVRPKGAERLMAPVLRRALRRQLSGDAARLRTLLEDGAIPAAGARAER